MKTGLSMFFAPKSIAVVGVSRNPSKAGHGILKNILWSFEYKDNIFPVNPSATEILGIPAFASLLEIPIDIDLVILSVPPKIIPGLMSQCYEKKVKGVIIESAGFAEVGEEGEKVQNEILKLAKKYNVRIWGANCMGTVTDTLVTTFEPFDDNIRVKGHLSIVGQSGYFGGAVLLQFFSERKIGIRKACSIGNKVDVDECDLLIDFLNDEKTNVAAFYLEGFKNPRKFLQIARKSTKPIICLLGGQSPVGKKAVLSHTSSTAHGSPELLASLLSQSGIIQVEEFGELFNVVEAFTKLPVPKGNKLAIVTITGAGGVIGADIASKYNIELPDLSNQVTKKLQQIFPSWMPPKNPVDSWPAFELHGVDKALRKILPILLQSDEIDMVILMIACMSVAKTFDPMIVKSMNKYAKPLITYFVGDKEIKDNWTRTIRSNNGVVFDNIRTCIRTLYFLNLFKKHLDRRPI